MNTFSGKIYIKGDPKLSYTTHNHNSLQKWPKSIAQKTQVNGFLRSYSANIVEEFKITLLHNIMKNTNLIIIILPLYQMNWQMIFYCVLTDCFTIYLDKLFLIHFDFYYLRGFVIMKSWEKSTVAL